MQKGDTVYRAMVGRISTVLDELRSKLNGKTIILGIGNTLKRDDGMGPKVVERIQGRIKIPVIDCGEAPENHTNSIRLKKPDTIIMIDAVDMKAKPGSVKLLKPDSIKNETFTTHSVSLRTFADFIKNETGAKMLILAVQPALISFGTELSPEVAEVVSILEKGLLEVFGSRAS